MTYIALGGLLRIKPEELLSEKSNKSLEAARPPEIFYFRSAALQV